MSNGPMPVGTVTFLFTDIEGSTRLWAANREAMQVALARHDALMYEAITGQNGIVFKTVGDAFCACFEFAPDSVRAALAAQIALATEPWPEAVPIKVRMAIHSGAVESRNDDYFGPPLNRVARLLAIGHGGQVLLSAAAQELVRDDLPDGAEVASMGLHRLKDLGRPEMTFQLWHASLPAEFPPLRSLDNPELRNNLPQQLTSFVGREIQMAEIKALMDRTRLLTLTGSGGAGKTRLAIQTAADALDGDCDGVWLAEFASLTDPSLVTSTVAAAIGVKEEGGKSILQSLSDYLKNRSVVLVLDNCEHLLDAIANLATHVLQQCPNVRILATSRESLGISGETSYRVPSLSLPDSKQTHTANNLSHYEAVRLFIDRAAQAQPSFTVTNENAPALASVCLRLDGIPLAIELAAARVRTLTLEDIDSRLDRRFQLLTGGSRTALPRQQTLRSLIDWSYDLLNEAEKAFLSQLSVFAGGWTLEAAEAICSGEPNADSEALDLLASLVDKSLVVVETSGTNARYRLLETPRQYARDRLLDRGDADLWRSKHFDYFLAMSVKAEPLLTSPEAREWLRRLETEQGNLRAALDWSGARVETHGKNMQMAAALWLYWSIRGQYSEGRERLSSALSSNPDADPVIRRTVLKGAGTLANWQGDFETAFALLEEALAIAVKLGNKEFIASSLNSLGFINCRIGDYAKGVELLKQSLAIAREVGDSTNIATILGNLAEAILIQGGDSSEAKSLTEESLVISRQIGAQVGIANALGRLGYIAIIEGEPSSAKSWYEESLSLFREMGFMRGIVESIEGLASVAYLQNIIDRAVRVWGAAATLREQLGLALHETERIPFEAKLAEVRSALGDDALFETLWAEGRAMGMDAAVELALGGPKRASPLAGGS
jgi:predicted ATPase/class 3 adenylate cyclase